MKVFKFFLAFLFGLTISLTAAEMLVANFGAVDTPPGLFEPSATRAFRHRPYFKGRDRARNPIEINSMGLRDREYTAKKTKGVFRILVLGDSVAFGDGIRIEDTFPKQLERMLNASDRFAEVLNGGVRGYNTVSELAMLKETGFYYSPDLVIVAYVLNDAEPMARQKGLIAHKAGPLYKLKEFIKNNFYLYSFFRRILELARRHSGPKNFLESYEDQFLPTHEGWLESYKALAEIKRSCDEKNAALLLVVIPRLDNLDSEIHPAWFKIQRQVVQAGVSLGIETLDLLPAFQKEDVRLIRLTARDIFHPNPNGHRIIAKEIEAWLGSSFAIGWKSGT